MPNPRRPKDGPRIDFASGTSGRLRFATGAHPPQPTLPPGSWLGLLGGGQLGRMFCLAAQALSYRVYVLDPDEHSPAGAVADDHLRADYTDTAALDLLAARCKSITTEFENVPADTLSYLAQRCFVSPSADAVAIAQDRIAEKRFIASRNIPVAPHAVITNETELNEVDRALFPGILKTARLGYDGKGQVVVDNFEAARAAWEKLGQVPCVLEKKLLLRQEVSCVVCRSPNNTIVAYPPTENLHRKGILAYSIAPARVPAAVSEQAIQVAKQIAIAMNYVGVLCVEYFVTDSERLVVNEIAPRPHNSGHYTIDACITSQFEQQVRIVAGLPLGSPNLMLSAVMVNLLGDQWFFGGNRLEPRWVDVLKVAGTKLHLYGKRDPRPGRKMGHLTAIGVTVPDALERANDAAAVLGIAPMQ